MAEQHEFHGKWFAATNEEDFSMCEPFDNREDAIAWGMEEFSNLADDDLFYTGQAEAITNETLFRRVPEELVERLNEYVYDNYGGDDDAVEASDAALDELRSLLLAWAEKNQVYSMRYTINDVKSHIVEHCKETKVDDKGIVLGCMRPIEHEGECDFV